MARRYYKPWESERTPRRDAELGFSAFFEELNSRLEQAFAQREAPEAPETSLQSFIGEGGVGPTGRHATPTGYDPGSLGEFSYGPRDVASRLGKMGVKEGIREMLGGTANPVRGLFGLVTDPILSARDYMFGKPENIKSRLAHALTEMPATAIGGMTLGPPGSVIGGILGRIGGSALADVLGIRSKEAIKDAVESMFSPGEYFKGRVEGRKAAEAFDTLGEMESAWDNPDFVKETTAAFMESIEEDPFSKYAPSLFESMFGEKPLGVEEVDPLERALYDAIKSDISEKEAARQEAARAAQIAAEEARERALRRRGRSRGWDPWGGMDPGSSESTGSGRGTGGGRGGEHESTSDPSGGRGGV